MKFYGLNTMKRENKVMDGETPDGRNFMIGDGRLKTRAGVEKNNTYSLGDEIMAISGFKSDDCITTINIAFTGDGRVISDFEDYPPIPQPNSLLAYWQFEETAGTIKDFSGNSIDGTYNGALYAQAGKVNNCLGFDGSNDNVSLGDTDLLAGKGLCSIMTWIYLETYNSISNSQRTISMDRQGTSSWQFYVNPSPTVVDDSLAGVLAFMIWIGGTGYRALSAEVIPLNQWVLVAGVYTGSGVKVYINGVQSGDTTLATGNIDTGSTLQYIGYGSFVDGNPWDGLIDELRIWDIALTDAEILNYFNETN